MTVPHQLPSALLLTLAVTPELDDVTDAPGTVAGS